MGLIALCIPLRNLFRGTKYCRPIYGLCRFRDPTVELNYQRKICNWLVFVASIHSLMMMIWNMCTLSSELSQNPLSLSVWPDLVQEILSCTLLVTISFIPQARRYVLPLHVLYSVSLNAMLAWKADLVANAEVASIQALVQPLLVGCPANPNIVLTKVLDNLATAITQLTFASIGRFQLLGLAFMGLSTWTLPAMLSFPVAFLTEMALSSTAPGSNLTVGAADYCCEVAAFLFIAISLEHLRRSAFITELLLAQELHHSRTSDSILNHMLKNTLADASGNIELYLMENDKGSEVGLHDSLVCLRRGIRYCRDRQAYLKLVAGSYVPTFRPVHLAEFASQLVAGRAVTVKIVDLDLMLDSTLMNLVLDNAITNACKHGCPENPDVQLSFLEGPTDNANHDVVPLKIVVSNRIHPGRPPITPQFVEKVFAGDPLPCEGDVPWLSDRIGLSHCLMAAEAHDVRITLTQDDTTVYFTATLLTKAARERTVRHPPTALLSRFPAGLTFFIMDDSPTSLRLLASHLFHSASPGAVRLFGLSAGDIDTFVLAALQEADIVICDQNLDIGGQSFRGTELISSLVAEGFAGLLCMRSADTTPEDVALYRSCGAHCTLGKDLTYAEFLTGIKLAYVDWKDSLLESTPMPPSIPCSMLDDFGRSASLDRVSEVLEPPSLPLP